MSRALSKSLGTDLAALAQVLRSKGRGRDTVLAHITPKEAALLKRRGGRGSINPDTGLPEYEDDFSFEMPSYSEDQFQQAVSGDLPSGTGDYADPATYDIPAAPAAQQQYNEAQFQQAATGQLPSGTGDYQAPDPEKAGFINTIGKYLSDPSNLAKLGLLGGLGIYGAKQGQTAAAQGQAAAGQVSAMAPKVMDRSAVAQAELQKISDSARTTGAASATNLAALGAPARDLGTGMISGAVSGNLTPANQQAIAALKARAEQDISKRGGVGAMQAGVAEESALAQLSQQQLQQGLATYQQGAAYQQQAIALQQAQDNMATGIQQQAISVGLQQAGIADQYTVNAIMLALQTDKDVAQSLKTFYTSLAQTGFSQSSRGDMKYDPYTGKPVA
jgi:hypothetical protein